ncbi:hypothetical protein [Flagellimonas sp.]|uniref:hypothetical protein n=1 Tax=Flagellimonas sp. TaxID=2058762 RepID=UPI003B50E4AF
MRLLVFITGLVLLSCKNQPEGVEDKLYDCMMSALSEQEKDSIKPIILEFEQHLVEKGILESSSAEGYWKFYVRIAETGVYDFSNDYDFMQKISFLNKESHEENSGLIECQNEILKSQEYLDSNQYKLRQELNTLGKHRVTQKMIAHTMIEYLNVEDFEIEYNRFMTLMYIEDMNLKSK